MAIVIATQDDSSDVIDTTQPDLLVTNLQGPPVGTIIAIDSENQEFTAVKLFRDVSFNVINFGNDVAPAGFSVTLFLSRSKTINTDSFRFREVTVNTTVQVGDFTRVVSRNAENVFTTNLDGEQTNITAGTYFLLARVGGATELDTSNNDTLAVGQLQIFDTRANINDPLPLDIPSAVNPDLGQTGSPNFVVERVSVPSFAFTRDAVNASQQQVTGNRSFDVSLQMSLRGAATMVEEELELRLFLSTDQFLSTDDLSVRAPLKTGQSEPDPLLFRFQPAAVNTVRQFANFNVVLPPLADFTVTLPQTFFLIAQVLPQGINNQPSQEMERDNYDNIRAAGIRTRVYNRFLQSGKAILPDLKIDSPDRNDPEALEFTTTAFAIPTPGSQRIFSFEIPDVDGINPDEAQVLILLQSADFDPILDLLSSTGRSIRLSDDSVAGQQSFISVPLSATGAGNNVFYTTISSLSGTGLGNFNLTIFLQARTDPNRPVITPLNLGNVLSLDRAQATLVGTDAFPVSLADMSTFTINVDESTLVNFTFQAGGAIADLTQATGDEVVQELQNQANLAGDLLDVSLNSDGKLTIESRTVGNDSALSVLDGDGTPAATLGLPVAETGLSENAVTFGFRQNQQDSQFVFYIPARGAFELVVEPSLDLFGGVTGSLQFFNGISQTSIPLSKTSEGADRTIFRAENDGPLPLAEGFYTLIFNAPQPIPNQDFLLRLNTRFDSTVTPTGN